MFDLGRRDETAEEVTADGPTACVLRLRAAGAGTYGSFW